MRKIRREVTRKIWVTLRNRADCADALGYAGFGYVIARPQMEAWPRRAKLCLFLRAEFWESWMGAQGISDRSELRKSRRNDEHDCQSQVRKIAAPRHPENCSGPARRAIRCRLSKTQTQGLIQIVAELGAPIAYPAPASRVTTTLYA